MPAGQTQGLEQTGVSMRQTGGRRPARQMQKQEVDEFLEFARSLRGDSAGEQTSWCLHDKQEV